MTDVMMLEESDYASEEFFDEDSESDFDEEENVVVVAKKPKAKKDTGAKKTVASVLSPNLNAGNVSKPKALGKGKTIEQIYQKKSQLEHILLRPDTYSEYYDTRLFVF
jgi:DNA topoisomerase-2